VTDSALVDLKNRFVVPRSGLQIPGIEDLAQIATTIFTNKLCFSPAVGLHTGR